MPSKSLRDFPANEIIISPSILASDFTRLGEEVTNAANAGIQVLHLDVMDGHFVPNLSIGVPVVASLRKTSDLIFDVHLMLTDPMDYVDAFAEAGANHITFHIESHSPIKETIIAIKELGLTVGLSLKPGTAAETVKPYLADVDMILVMTVEPGFGGQKFMETMLPKISQLRKWANELNPSLHIEVDGGIAASTASLVRDAGANVLVAGTAFFKHPEGMAAASTELQGVN